MRQRWCRCRSSTWAIISTFVDANEHHETKDGKRRLPAEQEKCQLHARILFQLVSWEIDVSALTSIQLQYSRMLLSSIAQLDLITMLCCSRYQRMRWRSCIAFRDDSRFIHVHVVFKLHNYQTPRLAAYADDRADVSQSIPRRYYPDLQSCMAPTTFLSLSRSGVMGWWDLL